MDDYDTDITEWRKRAIYHDSPAPGSEQYNQGREFYRVIEIKRHSEKKQRKW